MRWRCPADTSRRSFTAVAAALLLVTSCAGLTEEATAERRPADRRNLDRAATDAAGDDNLTESDAQASRESRTASFLPPSISKVWEVDETGLYVTVADGPPEVVAFDLSTGIELYRVDTHPAGALRGLPPTVYVVEDRNQFVSTVFSDTFAGWNAAMVVHDLDDGEVLWEAELPFGGSPLFDCGDDRICARTNYESSVYSMADQALEEWTEAGSGNVIAQDGNLLVASRHDPDNLDVFRGLTGFGDHGREELWSMNPTELRNTVGVPLDAGWGWNSDIDHATGVAALTLANANPDRAGGSLGVHMETGEVAWSRSGIVDCLFNYPDSRPMLKCVATDDDPTLVDRIVRMDPTTGEDVWSIAVATPFEPYDVEIVHGTEYLYVWVAQQVLVYDLETGQPVVFEGPYLCANSVWTYDVEYGSDEEAWEYFADILVVLCDDDGFLLHPLDVADTLADTDISASNRISFDWELRPFVLDAIPSQMIDGDSGEA